MHKGQGAALTETIDHGITYLAYIEVSAHAIGTELVGLAADDARGAESIDRVVGNGGDTDNGAGGGGRTGKGGVSIVAKGKGTMVVEGGHGFY